MPCSYSRDDVSGIVVDVLRQLHDDETITEESVFSRDIKVDDFAKRLYYFPIKMSVEKIDCMLKEFSPDDCERARKVKSIVDAVWKDVRARRTKKLRIGKKEDDGVRIGKKEDDGVRIGKKRTTKLRIGKKRTTE